MAYQNQYYIDGYMIGYVVLIIYTMGNIAAWRALSTASARSEYNVWPAHGCSRSCRPSGMVAVLLFSLGIIGGDPSGSTAPTLPAAPFNYRRRSSSASGSSSALVLVAYLRSSGHEDWMKAAAEGAAERPATPEEIEALKGEW